MVEHCSSETPRAGEVGAKLICGHPTVSSRLTTGVKGDPGDPCILSLSPHSLQGSVEGRAESTGAFQHPLEHARLRRTGPTSPEQAGSSPDKRGGGRGQEAEGEQQEAGGLHGSGGPARAKLYDKGRALIAGMTPQSREVS